MEQKLKEIGLTPNEIKLYLHLLEKGVATPPQLAKGLGLPRSNIHYLLQNLVEKGVAKKQSKGKRFSYVPAEPSLTLDVFDKKRKVLEEIIPDLEALYKKSPGKPVVKFYEGTQEVAHIFEDIVAMEGDLLCAFASLSKLFALMPEIPPKVQRAIKDRGIIFQEIVTPESRDEAEKAKQAMHPFHEYRVLPEKHSGFPTDVLVWDDSLALITLSEPVFGVVIISKPLAETYRIHFEIMWESLEKMKEEYKLQ